MIQLRSAFILASWVEKRQVLRYYNEEKHYRYQQNSLKKISAMARTCCMTGVASMVYNGIMKFAKYVWILVLAGWGIGALCAGQPPAEEKRSAESRGQDRTQGVPLDKLPVPENGLIVVTPDLKKALDALGAGSVVLSAERYLELMSRADKTKPDKPSTEIL